MSRPHAVAAALLLGSLGAGPGMAIVLEPRACAPGWDCGTFAHPEGARFHMRWLPAAWEPARGPWPVVLLLHGCTRTAANFAEHTAIAALADAQGFAVVMPEQSNEANRLRCWNWHVAGHQQRGRGEPAILDAMARDVWAQANPGRPFDRGLVFAAGLSAGGALTTVLGATYPDTFGALAVAAGVEYRAATCAGNDDPSCAPGIALALAAQGPDPDLAGAWAWAAGGGQALVVRGLVLHGDLDELMLVPNADLNVAQWAQTNDCADDGDCGNGSVDAVPEREVLWLPQGTGHPASVQCFGEGAGAPLMERWVIHGLTHQWPGGRPDPLPPDGAALAWAFFARGATEACA